MSRSLAVAVAVLVAGSALVGWVVSRGNPDPSGTDSLESDLARLRSVVEEQEDRISRLEAALGTPGTPDGRGSAPDRSPARPELAGRGGGHGAPRSGSLEHGREVLEALKANTDGTRVVAIREALHTFVRIGDPIVPEIAAALDSGIEQRYVEGRPHLQHIKGYGGLRMVLYGALREIGTPAAKKALFESLKHVRSVRDFRDLIEPSWKTTDPVLVEGISALVPDMLRSLAEVGITSGDGEAQDLATHLAIWIRKHGLTEAVGPLQEVILKAPQKASGRSYESLFAVLVEFAPESAAETFLAIHPVNPALGKSLCTSSGLRYRVPRAQLVRFYRPLLSGGEAEIGLKISLYGDMPYRALREIEDPKERAADAQVLVAFLEERLAAETLQGPKDLIGDRLRRLREDIEAIGK